MINRRSIDLYIWLLDKTLESSFMWFKVMVCIKKVIVSLFDREPLKAIQGITTSLSEAETFRKPFTKFEAY